MTKRKYDHQPHLWKSSQSNIYLAPYEQLDQFNTLHKQYPDATICYIRNWSPLACLMQMFHPGKMESNGPNCFIVETQTPELSMEFPISKKYTLKWDGKELTCLGSLICLECFDECELSPRTCAKHIVCSHKAKCGDCMGCISNTFAGCWKDWVACYTGGLNPFTISRGSKQSLPFHCSMCKHDFTSNSRYLMINRTFCGFCGGQQICLSDCNQCYNNSFASYPLSLQYWDSSKNGTMTPRSVMRLAKKVYWFTCPTCWHSFQDSPLVFSARTFPCLFCSHLKLCDDVSCQMCKCHSFASLPVSASWLHTKNQGLVPRDILLNCRKKYWFQCPKCPHEIMAQINQCIDHIPCGYCVNRMHCEDNDCSFCFEHSFASRPMVAAWDYEVNKVSPRQVAKSCNKLYGFKCPRCHHKFETSPNVLQYTQDDSFCPFCHNSRRCNADDCEMCFRHSFASHEMAIHWDCEKNHGVTPRDVALNSNDKYFFLCPDCKHALETSPSHIVSGKFCVYCAHQKLCKDECDFCFKRSFAAHPLAKFWNYQTNKKSPRAVSLYAHEEFEFFCPTSTCDHIHTRRLDGIHIEAQHTCPFCTHFQSCGRDGCRVCRKACEVCRVRNAISMTPSKLDCCRQCLKLAIGSTKNIPIHLRAKISMEIFMLADLQALAGPNGFAYTPTAWDAPVLPGLGFQPDLLYAFDANGEVIELIQKKKCKQKLKLSNVVYALQIEVMEVSRKHHTEHRSIPDEERAQQIRELFNRHNINIGVVWVTVASNRYDLAKPHNDDIFFRKNPYTNEYEVMESREEAWKVRIQEVHTAVKSLYDTKSNQTILIGH